MPPVARPRETCCLCDSRRLEVALELEPTPIGDAFATTAELAAEQPFLPLNVAVCRECGHAQLKEIVDPGELFVDYLFHTGSSAGLVEHFRRFAETMRSRFDLRPGDRVLEIGSNDGTLLRFFQQEGLAVQGVDPSRSAAGKAMAHGVPTENTFFTSALAGELARRDGPCRLAVAANVFAHSASLRDMTAGIARILSDDGVFVFEASYLVDLVERMLFDTVYHEHVSYHHVAPLVPFFRRHGLELWDVERIPSKGGSLRCFVQRQGGPHPRNSTVDELISAEMTRGVSDPAYLQAFARRLIDHRTRLHETLQSLGIGPGTLAGYGASPTTVTLIAHFQLAQFLNVLIDDNPQKQGRFAPGWKIPVAPSRWLAEQPPPFVMVLAWNFAHAIIERNQPYLAAGGRFLVPLPQISIVPSRN